MCSSIKNKIKKSFDKAAITYNASSTLQKQTAEILITMLQPYQNYFNTIADFACGTGISTEFLLTKLNYHEIYGIDFSEKLLKNAKSKIKKEVILICADFDRLIFKPNYLDLVFCNMGLQWSIDLNLTLVQIRQQLNDSGIFAFCLPVTGTFLELNQPYRHDFYSLETILSYLSLLQFEIIEVKEKIFVTEFTSNFSALRSIKNIGANVLNKKNRIHKGLISKKGIEKMFINNKKITLTYKIAFFICKKG